MNPMWLLIGINLVASQQSSSSHVPRDTIVLNQHELRTVQAMVRRCRNWFRAGLLFMGIAAITALLCPMSLWPLSGAGVSDTIALSTLVSIGFWIGLSPPSAETIEFLSSVGPPVLAVSIILMAICLTMTSDMLRLYATQLQVDNTQNNRPARTLDEIFGS